MSDMCRAQLQPDGSWRAISVEQWHGVAASTTEEVTMDPKNKAGSRPASTTAAPKPAAASKRPARPVSAPASPGGVVASAAERERIVEQAVAAGKIPEATASVWLSAIASDPNARTQLEAKTAGEWTPVAQAAAPEPRTPE
jgi:hypothetical protein